MGKYFKLIFYCCCCNCFYFYFYFVVEKYTFYHCRILSSEIKLTYLLTYPVYMQILRIQAFISNENSATLVLYTCSSSQYLHKDSITYPLNHRHGNHALGIT